MALRSLIVKIGADTTAIDQALAKVGESTKTLDSGLKKLGDTPLGKQAQQDAERLTASINTLRASQERLATTAAQAAVGITAIGGPTRLTSNELAQLNKTLQQGLDAFKALGQQAPLALQKVAQSVQQAQSAASGKGGGFFSNIFGEAGSEITKMAAGFASGTALVQGFERVVFGIKDTIVGAVQESVQFASHLDDLSKATNIGVESLQELGFAGKRVGLDLESIAGVVEQLSKRVGSGDASAISAIQGLGLNLKDLTTLAPDRLFTVLAEAVAHLKDPLDQASIGSALFGKQFKAALQLANDGLDQTRQAARDAGAVLGEDAVKKLDAFGDKVGDIGTVLKVMVADGLTPAIEKLTEFLGLVDRVPAQAKSNLQTILDDIDKGAGGLGQSLKIINFLLENGNKATAPGPFVGPQQPIGPTVNTSADTVSHADVIANKLNALRTAALEPLTAAQEANIASLTKGGVNEKEVADLVGASQQRVHVYVEDLKKSDEAQKKFAAAQLEMASASGGFGAIIESIDGSVVEAIKFYLQAGVSQNVLAEAYGLTAVQVKAVATDVETSNKLFTLNATVTRASASELANLGTVQDHEIQSLKESQSAREALRSARVLDLSSITAVTKAESAEIDILKETIRVREELRKIESNPNEIGGFNQQGVTNLQSIGHVDNVFLSPELAARIAKATLAAKQFDDALSLISQDFVQLAQVGGASFSAIAKGIGTAFAAAKTMRDSLKTLNDATTLSGLVAGFAGFAGAAIQAVGGITNAINQALDNIEKSHIAHDVGRDLGVSISQGVIDGIKATEEQLQQAFIQQNQKALAITKVPRGVPTFRQEATALNLPQIIQDAGGVDAFGFSKAITQAHDLFSLLEQGKLTVAQVGKTFEDVFALLVPEAVSKVSGLVSAQFAELEATAIRFGTNSPALDDFRNKQLDTIGSGLDTFLRTIDFQAGKGAKSGSAEAQLAASLKTVTSQSSAQAIGGSIAAIFAELQRQGKPLLDILKQFAPTIEAFRDQLKKTGFDGGAAFDRILGVFNLIDDKVAGPALQSLSGLQQILSGLANTGGLDQTIFSGLTDQIGQTFKDLTSKGFDADKIAQVLAPTLQTLFELQERGFVITDETTKNLLAQAVAQGKVGDQFKSAAERTVDGLNRTNVILESIANKLGAIVPKLPDPNKPAPAPQPPPERKQQPGNIPIFAEGGRVLPFVNQRTFNRHGIIAAEPGEIVLNAAQQGRVAASLSGSSDPVIHNHFYVDGHEVTHRVLDRVSNGDGAQKFNTLVRKAG